MNNVQIRQMTERMEQMEREIARLRAVVEIQNIMGRYESLLTGYTMDRLVPEVFAYWMEDVSMEVSGLGVFAGKKALDCLFNEIIGGGMDPESESGKADLRGALSIHHINTPMIEVAGDGRTAHAVWYSSGLETPFDRERGKRVSQWCWGKYSSDFIKGETGWRIWHLHWFRTFINDYYKSWVDEYEKNPQRSAACGQYDFVKPTTFHSPYAPCRETLPVPCCPDPYETHTDGTWPFGEWVKPGEKA